MRPIISRMPKMLQQFFWLLWLQPNTKQITTLYAAGSHRKWKWVNLKCDFKR